MANRPVPYPRWVTPADGSPRRIVQNHIQEQEVTGVPMHESGVPLGEEVAAQEEAVAAAKKAEYKPVPYPRVVKDKHGNKLTVQNHLEESYHTGVQMNEDGTVAEVVPAPEPAAPVLVPIPAAPDRPKKSTNGQTAKPAEAPAETKPVGDPLA